MTRQGSRMLGERAHAEALSLLARAEPAPLKALAEALLDRLDGIEVRHNRTGLVMLPMTDTVQGTDFHLGEVLVAEAQIRSGETEGYGMVIGRDLEQAMALAVIDLAGARGIGTAGIADLLRAEAARQQQADHDTLARVNATRVEMETF